MIPHEMFGLGHELAAAMPVFRDEFGTLQPEDFVPWPDRAAYNEGWLVFPLFMLHPHEAIGAEVYERNRRRCPRSAAVLDRSDVHVAGISRLLPGCHVFPHQDHPEPGVLRAHVGIRSSKHALMRLGDEIVVWADGMVNVFDHGTMHEAANLGKEIRDILLVDFLPTPAEQRALRAWRDLVGTQHRDG